MILLLKIFYSEGYMYFWWSVTYKQLLYNLRVNMLTSVVNIQVSRFTSQKYLTIHITLVFSGCISVCLVAQNQKKWPKFVLFMEHFSS